jgi:hypothetical protein
MSKPATFALAALFALALPTLVDARTPNNPDRGNDREHGGHGHGGRGGHGHGHDKETPSTPSAPSSPAPEANVGSSGPPDGPDTRRPATRDDACQWPFWQGTFVCRRAD